MLKKVEHGVILSDLDAFALVRWKDSFTKEFFLNRIVIYVVNYGQCLLLMILRRY